MELVLFAAATVHVAVMLVLLMGLGKSASRGDRWNHPDNSDYYVGHG